MNELITDIRYEAFHIIRLHGKCSIPILPVKIPVRDSLLLDPFGGALFHFFHQHGEWDFFGKETKHMNMIGMSADYYRWAIQRFAYAAEAGMQFRGNGGVDKRIAVFGAEYNVDRQFGERLAHVDVLRNGKLTLYYGMDKAVRAFVGPVYRFFLQEWIDCRAVPYVIIFRPSGAR
jgi:hypothetical protein